MTNKQQESIMTNDQLKSYRQNATPTFVPPVYISPFELGRRDAQDRLKRLAISYFHYRDDARIKEYNAGYNSVSITYVLYDLAQALRAFIGTPELNAADAEEAEDRIAEKMWLRQQEAEEAQSEYTDWRM